ncbi:hypothetical protein ACMFMF_010839 [Clarireedia jacksonii]
MSSFKGNHMLSNGGGALLGLRIAQLVVAVAVLGLSAYGIYYLSFDGDNMTLFSSPSLYSAQKLRPTAITTPVIPQVMIACLNTMDIVTTNINAD